MKTFVLSILTAVILACAMALLHVADSAAAFSLFGKYQEVEASDGVVTIPVKDVNDGKAHYYSYEHEGKTINFFLVRSADGVIRAAFDACDVCYHSRKGYSQNGDFMVCNNCGMQFHSTRINVLKGGCNPAPLKREQQGDQMVIAVKDIITGSRYY